jgi:hypothetical protein
MIKHDVAEELGSVCARRMKTGLSSVWVPDRRVWRVELLPVQMSASIVRTVRVGELLLSES